MVETPRDYDEFAELRRYYSRWLQDSMTPWESRCWRVAVIRQKLGATPEGWIADRLREQLSPRDEIAEAALADGIEAFIERVGHAAVREGRLYLARCPKCNRILRGPAAQQCLWCGHDWHERAS